MRLLRVGVGGGHAEEQVGLSEERARQECKVLVVASCVGDEHLAPQDEVHVLWDLALANDCEVLLGVYALVLLVLVVVGREPAR